MKTRKQITALQFLDILGKSVTVGVTEI